VLGHAPCPGAFSATWWAKRFAEQPHVARYVRHLRIVLDISQNPKPSFKDILSRVTRLESIALSSGGGMVSLSGSFRAAFLACIRSPRMRTVSVAHQSFSPSILNDCSIKNLIFRDVSLHFDPQLTLDDVRATTPSYPVLDSLTLHRVHLDHAQFQVWAKRHIRSLRSLTLLHGLTLFMTLSVLSPLCSDTLTSLHLDLLSTCTSSLAHAISLN
jgi:hypothetical protein